MIKNKEYKNTNNKKISPFRYELQASLKPTAHHLFSLPNKKILKNGFNSIEIIKNIHHKISSSESNFLPLDV